MTAIPTRLLTVAVAMLLGVEMLIHLPAADAIDDDIPVTVDDITAIDVLTGDRVPTEVMAEGLAVDVVRDGRTAKLRFRNPGPERFEKTVKAEVLETNGMIGGRMGPMTASVGTHDLVLSIPPGGEVFETLELRDTAEMGAFITTEIALGEVEANEDGSIPQVMLNWGGMDGRPRVLVPSPTALELAVAEPAPEPIVDALVLVDAAPDANGKPDTSW